MVNLYLTENLRFCRVRKSLTQEDMANKLNLERQTYCNYENGQRTPSLDILVNIADILEVSLDDLLRTKMQ